MKIFRLAAFSNGISGGNPAGVVIAPTLPDDSAMQSLAAEIGYSETAFAAPGQKGWLVRYFSPETEVPFCGHATIALGAALAMRHGDGRYALSLRQGEISVEGRRQGSLWGAFLQSPSTRSRAEREDAVAAALALFGLSPADLDPSVPPTRISAGADHLVFMLKRRETLAAMTYDFERGKALMRQHGWVTLLLGHFETYQRIHCRNAFAYGGVYEDPATGAATAALAGYLRELGLPHEGRIEVYQGDDMGVPSRLHAEIGEEPGSSIRLSGTVRVL